MEQPKDDGLKWFGDGFDGFPKRLPDDCVEYFVHIVNSKSDDTTRREQLRKIQTAATALIKRLLKNYIWQRDPFSLSLSRKDGCSFLRGLTNYGDSVEDEWLIVYLLRELSQQFPDAWIKVTDTDGEFLLIEAANTLPKWLNPEVADNRVWLNQGSLLIIPPEDSAKYKAGKAPPGNLSLSTALATIAEKGRGGLLRSQGTEDEAFYRLRNYPGQIQANLHHALVTIPRRLAFVLHAKPAYIAPAIEAFYLRDPIALRPLTLSTNDIKSLHFPSEDLVTARIRFTKVGYAQVKSQVFKPPGAWARAMPSNAGVTARSKAEAGMKVACGMEMLVGDPQNVDKKVVREIKLLLEDLEAGEEILPTDAEIKEWGTEEDDESWLDIDFNDLETELNGQKGGAKGLAGNFGDKAAQDNLKKMVERFEEFMNEDELEDMDKDDDDDTESEISDESIVGGEDKDGSFDEDEFTAMMREMMGMPPEVMKELMGPKAAKAKGVAKEDESINQRVFEAESKTKPVFGPERPPHMQVPEMTNSSDLVNAGVEDDVEEIHRDLSSDSEDDEAQIRELSKAMEAELKGVGALSLDDAFSNKAGKKKITGHQTISEEDADDDQDEESDEELLDENYNLVSNMLESFKSQGGMAGPGGNMLGMMGMKLPRDEDDGKGEGSSKAENKSH